MESEEEMQKATASQVASRQICKVAAAAAAILKRAGLFYLFIFFAVKE